MILIISGSYFLVFTGETFECAISWLSEKNSVVYNPPQDISDALGTLSVEAFKLYPFYDFVKIKHSFFGSMSNLDLPLTNPTISLLFELIVTMRLFYYTFANKEHRGICSDQMSYKQH
jgi:hypothetical protein